MKNKYTTIAEYPNTKRAWLEIERYWAQVLVMLNAHSENEVLTYFLAPIAPTSLGLRRFGRSGLKAPSRRKVEAQFDTHASVLPSPSLYSEYES